jgi:hypothetical protein
MQTFHQTTKSLLIMTIIMASTFFANAQDIYYSTNSFRASAASTERAEQYVQWLENTQNFGSVKKYFDTSEEYENFLKILDVLLRSDYMNVIDSLNRALPPEIKYGRKILQPFFAASELVLYNKTVNEVRELTQRGCDILRVFACDTGFPPYLSEALFADHIIIGDVIQENIPDWSFGDGYRQTAKFLVKDVLKGNSQADTINLRISEGLGEDGSYLTSFPHEPVFKKGDTFLMYLSATTYRRRVNAQAQPKTIIPVNNCTYLQSIPLKINQQKVPDGEESLIELKKFCLFFQ